MLDSLRDINPIDEARRTFEDIPHAQQCLDTIAQEIEQETLGPEPTDEQLESLYNVMVDMGQRLAFFRDGPGYGHCDRATLDLMAEIEERACVLLEAIEDPDVIEV